MLLCKKPIAILTALWLIHLTLFIHYNSEQQAFSLLEIILIGACISLLLTLAIYRINKIRGINRSRRTFEICFVGIIVCVTELIVTVQELIYKISCVMNSN